ncbi:MAG TPA: hypothetical protein PLV42_07000 [bacterium]|nr:hypothetical protein [bacterium]
MIKRTDLPLELRDQIDNLRHKVAFMLDVSATMLEAARYNDMLISGHKSLAEDVDADFLKIGATPSRPMIFDKPSR